MKNDKGEKEIISIEFGFENTDDATITVSNLLKFYMYGIKQGLYGPHTTSNNKNYLTNYTYCEFVTMTISADANAPFYEFGREIFRLRDVDTGEYNPATLFDRIKLNDICYITINYKDKTSYTISVDWNEKNDYTNYNQITEIDKNGNLIISICKKNAKKNKTIKPQ